MKTLVFYDNKGKIFYMVTGAYEIPDGGIQYLETEIPEGKMLVSVDVSDASNPTPIFEDIPEDEMTKRLYSLEEENQILEMTIDDILTNIIPSMAESEAN